jgi:hypothetical protein
MFTFKFAFVFFSQFELVRNVTVDLYAPGDDISAKEGNGGNDVELWRDYSGFVVHDRFRYCEVEFEMQAFFRQ